jgi:hypothetical protein
VYSPARPRILFFVFGRRGQPGFRHVPGFHDGRAAQKQKAGWKVSAGLYDLIIDPCYEWPQNNACLPHPKPL